MGLHSTFFLIFLVVMVCDVRGFDKRVVCRSVAPSCTQPLMDIVEDADEQGIDVDQACTIASEGRACMGGCFDIVTSASTEKRVLFLIANIACNETERQQMREVAQAQCFWDKTLEDKLEDEVNDCIQDELNSKVQSAIMEGLQAGITDVNDIICPLVYNVFRCIDGEVEDLCGVRAASVINHMINIYFNETLADSLPDCFEQVQVARQISKRSVEYLRMFRK